MKAQRTIGLIAFLVSGLATGEVVAQSGPDERAFWAKAFETGRGYAADVTLVAYCLRKDPATSANIYLNLIQDMNGIIELTRSDALSVRQASAFIHEVMEASHFAQPKDAEPALEKACAERDVENAYFGLQPIGWPLSMRAPFKKN